jgi:hypothetical protein
MLNPKETPMPKPQNPLQDAASNAESLAAALMSTGSLDEKAFAKSFGQGNIQDQEQFGLVFGCALATQAATALAGAGPHTIDVARPDQAETLKRFATGAFALDGDLFVFAMDCLKSELARGIPLWVRPAEGKGAATLSNPAKKIIARAFEQSGALPRDRIVDMIDALSDSTPGASGFGKEHAKYEERVARARAQLLKTEISDASFPGKVAGIAPRI